MKKSIGEKLSPILEEIEATLLEYEEQELGQPLYTEAGFRAASKIFFSVIMDEMWDLQVDIGMPMEDRLVMAEEAGLDIKKLIMKYTGIDTHKLYK